MAAKNYTKCFAHMIKSEGGYVDHPKDPGGATNYGITIGTLSKKLGRPATKDEVKNISMKLVREIYRESYWDTVKGNNLPDGFDLVAFDGGVNSGPSRGVRWLQVGLGVKADGVIGPKTLSATENVSDGVAVIKKACASRLSFLKSLRHWGSFKTGWTRRVAAVEAEAVFMYAKSKDVLIKERDVAKQKKKAQDATSATTGAAGATTTLVDVPMETMVIVAFVAVAIVIALVLSSRKSRIRTEAYDAKIEELANE